MTNLFTLLLVVLVVIQDMKAAKVLRKKQNLK